MWKNKHFENLDLNAIFFFFLTFGSKYTRQTADVELCRQGIEVSHRKWCTVPQGPARWDKTSLSQRFGGCRCDELGRGLKKKRKKKSPAMPMMD